MGVIMSRIIKTLSLSVIFCSLPLHIEAREVEYTLKYAENSPIKTVPLKDIFLEIALFQYNNPAGFRELKTDDHQSFSLYGAYDVEILSIQNQGKFKARCSGYGVQGNPKIEITCQAHNGE